MKRRQLGDLLRWIGWREGIQDTCAPWTHLLSLYADAEATPAQAQRVEAHLASCTSCRASLALLRATTHVASGWTEQELPSGLSERLSLAIADEARKQRVAALDAHRATRRRFGVPQMALGGVALFTVIGIGVYLADHPALPTHPHPSSVIAAKPAPGQILSPGAGSNRSTKPTVVASQPIRHSVILVPHRIVVAAVPHEARPILPASPFVKQPMGATPPIAVVNPHRAAHAIQEAAAPKPQYGGFTHPHLKSRGPVNTEVARAVKPSVGLPRETGIPTHEDGVMAPAPSVTVAAAIPAATPDTPVVRLASTLVSLARSTQHIEPGTDKVSVSMVRAANYTGSATIVGSAIH